jgi:hypothetical protein
MTQILSLLIPGHVFQVSDRQISDPDGRGAWIPRPQEENKAVLWGRRVAFSYSGVARIGAMRVDLWLTSTLAGAATNSLSDACEHVRREATAAFDKMSQPADEKRCRFVAVGFTCSAQEQKWRPIAVEITNCMSGKGGLLQQAEREFTMRFQVLRGGYMVGWSSPPPVRTRLERILWAHLSRGATLQGVVQHLARMVRESAKFGTTIGSELMAAHIPEPVTIDGARGGYCYPAGHFSQGGPSFAYLPTVGPPRMYGPNVVEMGTSMTDFEAGPV